MLLNSPTDPAETWLPWLKREQMLSLLLVMPESPSNTECLFLWSIVSSLMSLKGTKPELSPITASISLSMVVNSSSLSRYFFIYHKEVMV